MSKTVQKRYSTLMMLFMSLILVFGTILPASASYASETETPDQPTAVTVDGPDPLAPQNLKVVESSITATTATIAWDLHEDKAKIDIDVWDANNDKYLTWGKEGSRTLDGLKPETKYRLYVTWEVRPATLEHKSNIIEFTTLAGGTDNSGPPTNIGPRNLTVGEITHNSVSLTWDPIPGLKAYWIWDVNNKYIIWANDGAKVVGGLEPETTYSFYVGPDGIQAPNLTPEQKSNLVTFTTLADTSLYPDPPLTAPSYLKVSEVTDASITLNWGVSPKATGYDIYVNGGWSGGTWNNTATSSTYAPEGGLITGQTYVFEVGAQAPPDKPSAKSNKVTIKWGELEAPKGLKVVTATRTTVALGWAPVSGATNYDIYKDDLLVGTSDSNRYVSTGLTEGQSYSFEVVAKNSLWKSAESYKLVVIPGSNYNLVTYYTSWSINESARNFKPTDIDVSQVTHINYAFSDLCWKGFGTGATACQNKDIPLQKDYVFDGEMIIGDPEVDLSSLATFAAIRDDNPHLNLLVSVGGWSWSKNFSNMAATEETRRAFANSVVAFLREYKLDGIDIDWEYPVEGGELTNSRGPQDKENFTLLVKTVREALDAAGSEDGKYYLQTIASGQGDNFTVNADFVNSTSYLDFVNIMTYDYSGNWETLAHHNAPLYADDNNPFERAPRNNVQGGVMGHLNGGVPNYKLVVGIPFYGKGWKECPAGGQYQTCAGGTSNGTWESSIFDYTDVETNYVNKNGYVRYWNEASKVAYVYNSETKVFITYNDKESMMYTASFLKSLDLAGVMSWEISGDRNKTLTTQLVKDLPINNVVSTTALAAPRNLKVNAYNQNTIDLKWDSSAGATGYEVYQNKKYVGYTTESKYTLDKLTANTNYNIHVIAIVRDKDHVQKVSINSNSLNVTTQPNYSLPSLPPVNKPKDQLDSIINREGDKIIVKLQPFASIATINQSTSTTFGVVVNENSKQIEIIIPKEIIAAIAAKGEHALLTIKTNEVVYTIPVQAVNILKDIKITIQAPVQSIIDQMMKQAQESGMEVVVVPLDFKIEQLNTDQTYVEISNFGNSLLSRKYIVKAENINLDRATGIIFIPSENEIRSVPTLFTVNTDGTVTVELKRQGNSIYSIITTNNNFKDVTQEWMLKDVPLSVTKLLTTGESKDQFGVQSRITRAEVASLIIRALGIVPGESSATFSDVDINSKYAREIGAAQKAGLIKGKTASTFGPNDTVTRQDLAVMLANAMNYAGIKNEAKLGVLDSYNDQTTVASYAKSALALMVDQKIMIGVSPTLLSPKSFVTKAQASVTIIRMLRALELSN